MAMQQVKANRKSLQKVALTKKIEDSEKQLIVSQHRKVESPLVEGKFVSYRCGEHYSLHGGQSFELTDSEVVSIAPASVIITILLDGQLEFGYSQLNFKLDAAEKAQGVIVNLDKPTNFRRKIISGNQVTKLNIMLSPSWLTSLNQGNNPNIPFLNCPDTYQTLHINDTIVQLAQQLIHGKNDPNWLQSIHTEVLSHQLIFEVCQQLSQSQFVQARAQQNAPVNLDKDEKINQAIHYIESNLGQDISLEMLASNMMMSISNLQRRFKQELGLTVAGYIRQRRLEIAKQHLERGSMSITEAAYDAGYYHPSNFSNAFKKTFGVSPTHFLEQQMKP